MNHRELTIASACLIALIATTADAAKACKGRAKERPECQPERPIDPGCGIDCGMPEYPKDEPKTEQEPKKQPDPVNKRPALITRENGKSAGATIATATYCLEQNQSLITDQTYLGGKYGAPKPCCVEAVSRWDAMRTCKIVWGQDK